VVADDVDHPVPLGRGERPQGGEQHPVLGPGQRHGHRVATAGVPHAQQVEEVAGQDQLNGSVVVVEVLQQHGELRRGLEDIAAR
jgi:hypothetical protein